MRAAQELVVTIGEVVGWDIVECKIQNDEYGMTTDDEP
jgi:hypothetical protein